VNKANNRFKSDNKTEKLTAYSAMFSLNYFKGFSVFRTFTMDETALMICNMAYKLEKGSTSGKKGFYQNLTNYTLVEIETNAEQVGGDLTETTNDKTTNDETTNIDAEPSEKDYVNVIKKVKKENVTPDNIGEIMLCQIPGISSVTALAIMDKFKTFPELIKQVEVNNECLKDISYTNAKGQTRKINKTSIANIVKYLLKK
jgi:ERCC4-type nuclease